MKNRRRLQNALQRPMVRWSWFFLLPMVSAFAIGFVWPFLQGIYLSFCDFRLISDAKWVGLKN
jgi:raffinose/stachyose/melibiose transport system permease protein